MTVIHSWPDLNNSLKCEINYHLISLQILGKAFIRPLALFMPLEGLGRRSKQMKITALCGIFASYLTPMLGIGLNSSLEPSLSMESRVLPWYRLIQHRQQNHQDGTVLHAQIFYGYWQRHIQKRFKLLVRLDSVGRKIISFPEFRCSGFICCYKSQCKCESWGVLNEVLFNALSLAYHLVMSSEVPF